MKSTTLGLAGILLLAGVSFAAPQGTTYTGEIMDSACAVMGSHEAMTKNNPEMTSKDCTVA
jgi:hypothetical protein